MEEDGVGRLRFRRRWPTCRITAEVLRGISWTTWSRALSWECGVGWEISREEDVGPRVVLLDEEFIEFGGISVVRLPIVVGSPTVEAPGSELTAWPLLSIDLELRAR